MILWLTGSLDDFSTAQINLQPCLTTFQESTKDRLTLKHKLVNPLVQIMNPFPKFMVALVMFVCRLKKKQRKQNLQEPIQTLHIQIAINYTPHLKKEMTFDSLTPVVRGTD